MKKYGEIMLMNTSKSVTFGPKIRLAFFVLFYYNRDVKERTADMPVAKKVTLELVGLDSNAFALMGAFKRQARREKWTTEEIDEVLKECMSGDYNHLLNVLKDHCKSPVFIDDDADNEPVFEEEDEE
jgi:hypothetical protein